MFFKLVNLLVLLSLCFAMHESESNEHSSHDHDSMGSDDISSADSSSEGSDPNGNFWDHDKNTINYGGMRMFGEGDPLVSNQPDPHYCEILINSPVPVPVDQIPLSCICSYCKGTVGPKGDRGDRGHPGAPGSPGTRGMTGYRGNRGFKGPIGIKGQKGDFGEKGQTGVAGFIGSKGAQGLKGEKGDQGSLGPPGSQGPQGETGTCPESCNSIPGAPGQQGPPGPAGGRGLPGVQGAVGPKGTKGVKGDLGRPGDPGVNGVKGDQGEQGVCECTDGNDGTNGEPGQKGDKGDKGDTGAQGVQGPVGSKGDLGDMGLMGLPGPCTPTIQSAFSATLQLSFPGPNWPVAFEDVLTNRQGHYNPSIGLYTAPVDGIYVFSLNLAVHTKPLKVGIYKNFHPVVRAAQLNYPSMISQKVVLQLIMGDRIWLQCKDSTSNGMFADDENTSMFSGYLLYPDTCEIPIGRDFGDQWSNTNHTYSWDGPQTTTSPQNPADKASRGTTEDELLSSNWLTGPEFFWEKEMHPPAKKIVELPVGVPEMLLGLLGLVSLFSISSSEHPQTTITHAHTEEEGSSSGLSSFQGSSSGKAFWPSGARIGIQPKPALVRPLWLPGANMTAEHEAHDPEEVSQLCDVLLNSQVPPTAEQLPFVCICSLCNGTVGPKGQRGDQGPPGNTGSPGRKGLIGLKGHTGFKGMPGMKGQKGHQGEKGEPGEAGFMGSKGDRGFKGGKGEQGFFGPPGAQGPHGENGTCPASCMSDPSAQGSKGPAGTAGGRGLPGLKGSVGPKGVRGAKGDLGSTGDPGVNGQKGDQGDQGLCVCTDGTNGTDGDPGQMGIKGDKGDAGDQGVQGSEGLKGHQGDLGLPGPAGPCTPAIQSAFSATLDQSFPKNNWPVVFNHVLSNEQGHFNPLMGIYTAPVNGTYVFTFDLSVDVKPLKVGLFLNFNPLFKTTESNTPAMTSQETVHHLTMGDQVWLQVKDNQTNGMFTDSETTSTFSGYLLFPDTCEFSFGQHFGHNETFPNKSFSWDGYESLTATEHAS
ncbi:collagen alpha-1(V) chain [Gouania willdenowi]|uniref:collagen alpha-1(V) chain n=1 Tax=Gouania willdenowi TaxID=441366 RepID=UPI001055DA14|nr:collagen alpha-1(V) chain-like [Gouania willdenowi]